MLETTKISLVNHLKDDLKLQHMVDSFYTQLFLSVEI